MNQVIDITQLLAETNARETSMIEFKHLSAAAETTRNARVLLDKALSDAELMSDLVEAAFEVSKDCMLGFDAVIAETVRKDPEGEISNSMIGHLESKGVSTANAHMKLYRAMSDRLVLCEIMEGIFDDSSCDFDNALSETIRNEPEGPLAKALLFSLEERGFV